MPEAHSSPMASVAGITSIAFSLLTSLFTSILSCPLTQVVPSVSTPLLFLPEIACRPTSQAPPPHPLSVLLPCSLCSYPSHVTLLNPVPSSSKTKPDGSRQT